MHKVYYNPEIQILICKHQRLANWHYQDLAAPFWRVYCNFNDTARFIAGGKEYRLQPGKVFLISPDTSFSSENDGEMDHFYLHFQAGEPFDLCSGVIMSWEDDTSLLQQVENLKKLLEDEDNDDIAPEQRKTQHVELSMRCMLMAQTMLLRVPQQKLQRRWNDKRVLKVIQFMEEHYPERLTNQMFADIADMNPNAFARLFKEETGLAPQRFLMHKRIKEACLQLRYSKYTIDEIADNIGFCDRHYFSRIFTKMRCMSPANFRKLQH